MYMIHMIHVTQDFIFFAKMLRLKRLLSQLKVLKVWRCLFSYRVH